MKDKKSELLSILQQSNEAVTGRQLARMLDCSSRTIINYVNSINAQYKKDLIISSQSGYLLNGNVESKTDKTSFPQNKQERIFYILKKLLLSKDGIDIFDLSEELFSSYSLIKKEITEFNASFKQLDISIVSLNNQLIIKGSEEAKRKVMTTFIHQLQGDNFLDLKKLKLYFSKSLIENIVSIITNNVGRFNGTVDDFALLNLTLHLAIITNRLYLGEELENVKVVDTLDDEQSSIAEHIIREVEITYSILLNKQEKLQMTALINSHIHLKGNQAYDSDSIIDKNLAEELKMLLDEVKTDFYMDFTGEEFFTPFVLHIQNLLLRLKRNISIENPIKETFRNSEPFLYDVAVFIVNKICLAHNLDPTISDNELTFIVMHLALEIERQKHENNHVKVLLYTPRYAGIEKNIANELKDRFESTINIVEQVYLLEDVDNYDYDVLVSFVNVEVPLNKRFVKINPILQRNDYTKLGDVFTCIEHEKLLNYFKNVYPFFFDENNFLIEKDEIDEIEAISKLSAILKLNAYVLDGFKEEAIKREKAISTAFNNFAVPHGVSSKVINQTVAVMIAPNGIKWGNNIVYCVMLMAINPRTIEEFQAMYNALLLILLESNSVEKLRSVNSFKEFSKIILANSHL